MPLKTHFILFLITQLFFCDVKAQNSIAAKYLYGNLLYQKGSYDSADLILTDVLKNYIDDSLKGEILVRIGLIKRNDNIFDTAIIYFKEAVQIWEQKGNRHKINRNYINIAETYMLKKNYPLALSYSNLALQAAENPTDSINSYLDCVTIYQQINDYKKTYELIKDVFPKFESYLTPDQRFSIKNITGIYFSHIKNFDSSLFYFKVALKNASAQLVPYAYNNISDTYRELGDYKKALIYQDSSFFVSQQNKDLQNLLANYDTYSQIYEQMGDMKSALKYSQLARNISDSFFNDKQTAAMQDAEVKYQTQKTIAQKNKLEKESALKSRNLILAISCFGIVAALAVFGFRSSRLRQQSNLILTQQKKEVEQLAQNLEMANQTKARLFSTIGHDLRSPISSLYTLLKMQEINGGTIDAATMSSQTINLLDTLEDLLVWSKTQMDRFVPMPIKLDINELYEELIVFFAGTAAEKNITVINETKAGLTLRCDENILRTIFRNAIGNGLNHTNRGGKVLLQVEKMESDKVVCMIKNACTKYDFQRFQSAFNNADVQSGSHGLGLVLIKEFAQKVNANVSLTYTDGWAAMLISIPVDV